MCHKVPYWSHCSLLFYVNDLPLHLENSSCTSFADDTTLHVSNKSLNTISTYLNADLKIVENWCLTNKLCINPSKTKSMIITTSQKRRHIDSENFNLTLAGKTIDCVSSERLLGVTISNNLDWCEHISTIESKINSKLFLLARIKKFLPLHSRKLFYYCFISPHINYCSNVWSFTSSSNIYALERLQRRAMRLILDTVPPLSTY